MPEVPEIRGRGRGGAPYAPSPRVSPVLVGRARERARVVGALRQPPAVVAIEGEPGIGKTRLLEDLRGELGGQVLVGHCLPLREPLLLGPVIEAVRRVRVAALSDPVLGALRPLLPELADRLPSSSTSATDRSAERHRIFRALRALLRACGETTLIVEDLQWADTATLDFLRFLVASPPGALNVVLTHRPEDRAAAALVASAPGVRSSLALRPLTLGEVRDLAGAIFGTGDVSANFAAYLHRKSGGVPFAAEEIISLLLERGDVVREGSRWIRRTIETLQVPPALRGAVLERLAGAPEDAIRIARSTAVLHVRSTEEEVVRTADLPGSRGWSGLSWCLDSQLLQEEPPGWFAFRHELARDAIYESLSPSERRRLHLDAARILARNGDEQAARVAFHLRCASRPRAAAPWGLRAARLAIEGGDDHAAAEILTEGLELPGVPKRERVEMATLLGETALHGLTHTEALPSLERVLRSPSLPAGARGEILLALGLLRIQAGEADDGFTAIRRAVPSLRRRPASAARAMGTLGSPWRSDATEKECRRWLDRAVDAAHRHGDPVVRTTALVDRASFLACSGPPDLPKALAAVPWGASTVAEKRQLVRCCLNLAQAALHRGSLDDAQRWYDEGMRRAEALGYRRQHGALQATRLLLDWSRGAWDGLESRAEELAIEHAGVPHVAVDAKLVLGLLALARGDRDAAASCLAEVAATARAAGAIPAMAAGRAGLLRLRGAGAARTLADASGDLAIVERSGNWAWAPDLAWHVVATCLDAGLAERAAALVSRIRTRIAGRDAPGAQATLDVCDGLIRAAAGDRLDAAASFERALPSFEGSPYRVSLAWELLGMSLDGAARSEALTRAVEGFRRLGAKEDAARATSALGGSPRWRGGRRGYGFSLSPREREVAALVAQGKRNREIADELFLSPRTVEGHVARAMHKVGATSRTALALAVTAVEGGSAATEE